MQIEASAKRGAAIVRQLLAFSRDLPQTPRGKVDVAAQIDEMMDIMRGTFPREIKLVAKRCPPDFGRSPPIRSNCTR